MKFTNYARKKPDNVKAEILATKPIEILSEDGETVQYTLEFSRSTATELEESGFDIDGFGKGKLSEQQKQILLLFAGSFRMHHSDDTALFRPAIEDGKRSVEADDEEFEKLLYGLDDGSPETLQNIVKRLSYLYYKPSVALSAPGNKKRKIR
jgi:hypothetical protein